MHRMAILLACLSTTVASQPAVSSGPREVTIDAAFRFNQGLYLISGHEYMVVSPSGFEVLVLPRAGNAQEPVDMPIQAAVVWPLKPLIYFFAADVSFRNNQTSRTSKIRAYGRGREFLQTGGPDAAAFRSGKFYIFKGCQVVAQRGTMWRLGEPRHVHDLGLPCDLDAAWTDEDLRGMTVLKGNRIWKWRQGVTGPIPFEDDYHIRSWRLKDSEEEAFVL